MRRLMWGLAIVSVLGGVLIGCPATHGEFPGTACKVDSDCYVGEMCVNMVCALPVPDMTMSLDFDKPDFRMLPDMMGDDL